MALQSSSITVPWVEKYRPKTFEDFIGNIAEVRGLEDWLKNWKQERKKTAWLSGPAGVGKTSVVLYLVNKYGFEFVEVNASDKRNKKAIERNVGLSSTEGTVLQGARVKKLILVDEADGLFGNEDRGGAKALAKVVERARIPIICTANDPKAAALKAAKKSMRVFNFERLKDHEILILLKRIIKKESLSITEEILAKIATNSHGDARSAINDLEGVAFVAISADITFSPRNQEQNLNQVLTNIFMAKDLQSAKRAIEGADLDYRELLMYVYEHAYKQAANSEETLNMYELISEADFYLSQCYIKQEWKFLKYFFQFISSVGLVKESSFKYSNFGFPSYWGLMGKFRVRKAKIKKLSDKAEQKLHSSTKLFETDIYPYLRIIFRTDPRMAAGIAVWLRFDQDDVDFLTGGSNKVTQEIMKHHELAYQQMAKTWITEIREVKPINILDFTKKPKKRGIKPKKAQLQTPSTKNLSQTKPVLEKTEKTPPVLKEKDTKGKKDKKKKPSQASLEKFFN